MTVAARVSSRGQLAREAFREWRADECSRRAAALSFFTALSLAPLLIVVIAVAGLVWGEEAVRGAIAVQMRGLIGADGAKVIETVIANARDPELGTLAAILGTMVLVFGATGVFAELQDSLNKIWHVEPKAGAGLRGMLRQRFLSFAMVLGIAFLLLVSLVLSAALSALGRVFNLLPEWLAFGAQLLNMTVSLVVTTVLFAMIYKLLPDAQIRWRHVFGGALMTAVSFAIGKYFIGLYLGTATVGSAFGAAGSLVVLLVWVYYSAQLLFYGAELTKVYARAKGHPLVPAPHAQRRRDRQKREPPQPHPSLH
jgi:membrane protein